MKKATNSLGKEVDLPASPVKEEGETQDDLRRRSVFEHTLSTLKADL